jgi:membrane protease YdiL (CAAX protease family)
MDYKRIIKMIMFLIAFLVVLQLLRTGIEQGLFIFIQRTYFTDDIATMISMLILTSVFTIIMSIKQVSLSIFPSEFGVIYIIGTLVFIGLLFSAPAITGEKALQAIVLMIYGSVVTPIFEEIIFRGYIWNKLNDIFIDERVTYIIVTLLFAIWHLGYLEGIAFRASEGLAIIMLWKLVVGFCFGIILGAVRIKTKNCYSTIVLHGIMNIFGR